MAETQNQLPTQTAAPPSAPVAPIPSPPAAPAGGLPTRKSNPYLWLVALVVVILGISFLLIFRQQQTQRQEAQGQPTPTLTPTPSPTPYRTPSALASQSAFLNLDVSLASFSANLGRFPAADPQLVPPVLDLTLGFSN